MENESTPAPNLDELKNQARKDALDEMVRETEKAGLYDIPEADINEATR